jgi:hypothetical protein
MRPVLMHAAKVTFGAYCTQQYTLMYYFHSLVLFRWSTSKHNDHTAGFTENNRAAHLLLPVLDTCMAILMYSVNLLF